MNEHHEGSEGRASFRPPRNTGPVGREFPPIAGDTVELDTLRSSGASPLSIAAIVLSAILGLLLFRTEIKESRAFAEAVAESRDLRSELAESRKFEREALLSASEAWGLYHEARATLGAHGISLDGIEGPDAPARPDEHPPCGGDVSLFP